MGAWGLCGVLGAALGAVSARRLGRIPLAVACAAAGLIFGAIMDFSTWTAYSGEHTVGQYLAISGTSLGFNLAHAAGNLVFCLAFGPAFVRALLRFRARLDVRWAPVAPAGAGVALLALVAALGLALVRPAAAPASPAGSALRYLLGAENGDGGFGAAPGQGSAQLYTAWATIGIAAAGRDPRTVRRAGHTPCGYLGAGAGGMRAAGDVERTILALAACRSDSRRAGGVNLVARLRHAQRGDGSFAGQVNLSAFGILALRAAGRPPRDLAIRRAAAFVARQQNGDGGFNFLGRGGPSGSDDTAGAVEALVAAGRPPRGAAIARGVRWLLAHQNPDGGFALTGRGPSNAQSTAFAVQALVAAGRSPDRVRRHGSRTPLGYLASLTGADGAVRYSRTSGQTPVWVTAQALAALSRRPLPVIG
jgi:energy-coupling factor transport system substrate-specific component